MENRNSNLKNLIEPISKPSVQTTDFNNHRISLASNETINTKNLRPQPKQAFSNPQVFNQGNSFNHIQDPKQSTYKPQELRDQMKENDQGLKQVNSNLLKQGTKSVKFDPNLQYQQARIQQKNFSENQVHVQQMKNTSMPNPIIKNENIPPRSNAPSPLNQKDPNANLESLMNNYYQKFQGIPMFMCEQYNKIKKPQPWKMCLDENKRFTNQLIQLDLQKQEYMNQEIDPKVQQFEVSSNIFQDYQKRMIEENTKFQSETSNLVGILNYYQQIIELQFQVEKGNCEQQKDISKAFSGLSSHIWEYLQKNFTLDNSQISQDTAIITEVSERITSQKAWDELSNNSNFEEAKLKFQELLNNPKPEINFEKLREFENSFSEFGLIDDQLAKELFGTTIKKSSSLQQQPPKQSTLKKSDLIHDYEVISQHFQQSTNTKIDKPNIQNPTQDYFETDFQDTVEGIKNSETQQSGYMRDYMMDIEPGSVHLFAENESADFNAFQFIPEEEFSLNPER